MRAATILILLVLSGVAVIGCTPGDEPPIDDGELPTSTPDGTPGGRRDSTPTKEDEQLISDFLRFAADPGPDRATDLPFADEVALGLGDELHLTRSPSELADPGAWVIDVEIFRAYTGPFSALDVAADSGNVLVSVGDHPHCVSPPQPAPDEFADLRRVGVQPELAEDDSCLRWWTVDLFVTRSGEIAAVTLDLYEP